MGIRAVPHLPCSFDCGATAQFGEAFLEVGRKSGLEYEMDWIDQILAWPVEWSALHGIAEIRTPILKISTRTDSTASKYSVLYAGSVYPEEGTAGLLFPYQKPRRHLVSGSRGFGRGLRNAVRRNGDMQSTWLFEDNGFRSLSAMEAAHKPIVALAKEALSDRGESLIDLGCGNGVLIRGICNVCDNLVPYGIDRRTTCVDHARKLLPRFSLHFTCGDLFDLTAWPATKSRFSLAIIMAGRLLEVEEKKATSLVDALRHRCDGILLYLYADWKLNSLNDIAERFSLGSISTHFRNPRAKAGLIRFK